MTDGGRSRRWWARPAGLVAVGVVLALAIGGTVWAVTSTSSGNQATPTRPAEPPGSASTTTTAPPGASSTAPGIVTPTTTGTAVTVHVPDVVTGTVVSSAEQMLQGVRLQYMLQTQPVSACTLSSGAYNQNAVLWQKPSAGSLVEEGSQVILGVC